MHERSGVVIMEQHKVALIKRTKNGRTYYTFPGGKVEAGETLEQAAVREAYEELGVYVQVGECMLLLAYNGMQSYFRATIERGEFGTGNGEEFRSATAYNTYEAVWMAIDALEDVELIPQEMKAVLRKELL